MRSRFLVWAAIVGIASAAALVSSCGARSQLDVPGAHVSEGGGGSGGHPERDAGKDAHHDAPKDAPPDVPPDVPLVNCVEAGITYVYLMTAGNDLLAFYPPDKSVSKIGAIHCPAAPGTSPFSMAVDRNGIAYVLFDVNQQTNQGGELFRVSTADASCKATTYHPNQHGFITFGMGFSANVNDPGETLYVSQITFGQPSLGLGKIDTDTFKLDYIAPYSQNFGDAMELTGTGDAKLYGYVLDDPGSGGHVLEIDKTTADILSSKALGVGDQNDALAFAFWGGDFYVFTSPPNANTTSVHQWDPTNMTLSLYTTIPKEIVVGAGVSTCAPAH